MNTANKLSVTVGCSNKTFRLNLGKDGNWMVRFTPERAVRELLGLKERVYRSTGRKDLSLARNEAKRIVNEYYPDKLGKILALERKRAAVESKGWPTLREILDRFLKYARSLPDKDKMRRSTVRGYVHAFERLVETRFDNKLQRFREHGYANKITVDRAVDPQLWNAFKENYVQSVQLESEGKPQADQRLLVTRAKRNVNFIIGNARSIFGHEFMRLYADPKFGPALKLPDLTPLRTQVKKYAKVTRNKFKALPVADVLAIEAEVQALRAHMNEMDGDGLTRQALEARGAVICYGLAIRLAFRKGDALAARRDWLRLDRPVPAIVIADEDGNYDPKGIDGALPVPADLLADILALGGADYLVPSPNREKSWDIVSAIVRRYVGEMSSKTMHQLRKQAISNYLIACNGNPVEAAKFARHADPRTTLDFYGDALGELKTLGSCDWRKLVPGRNDCDDYGVIPFPLRQEAI